MRLFRLSANDGVLERALDRIHVSCTVLGALVGASRLEVAIAEDALPELAGVVVEDLGDPARAAPVSGREADRPLLLAPDLLVRPPWTPRPEGFTGLELVVPRGMAFGSGEHASTQAALLLLHETWQAPASLLDVGTGSGILLAYAAARGCPRLCGCDLEGDAVAAATALVPKAQVLHGGPEGASGTFACVVANLALDELRAALPALLARWDRTGPLLLSGARGEAEASELCRLTPATRTRALARGEFCAQLFCADS